MDTGVELIQKYFPNLNPIQLNQYRALGNLYKEWNEKINVISRKDIDHLYEHHILHSLAIAKFIEFKPDTKIMDIGTGGGFPGIPLAIMFPECKFYLIDSIGKKIKVVTEIANSIGLKNIKAEQIRAENVKQQFDFIVSRAVTDLPSFVTWVKNKINTNSKNQIANGILYLRGGITEKDMQNLGYKHKIIEQKNYFPLNFFESKQLIYLYK